MDFFGEFSTSKEFQRVLESCRDVWRFLKISGDFSETPKEVQKVSDSFKSFLGDFWTFWIFSETFGDLLEIFGDFLEIFWLVFGDFQGVSDSSGEL